MIEVDAMFPVIVVQNLEVLKEFYESFFGFKAVYYDPNFYLHLTSSNGNIQLGFLIANHESQPLFLRPLIQPEGFAISLEVKDATHAFSQATQQKLNIVLSLKEEVWGQTHFIVKDPAGIYVDIVQH